MTNFRRFWGFLAVAALAARADATDFAREVPADTLLFLSWDRPVSPTSETWKFYEAGLTGLERFLQEQGVDDLEELGMVFDLVRQAPASAGAVALIDVTFAGDEPAPEAVAILAGLHDPAEWLGRIRAAVQDDEPLKTRTFGHVTLDQLPEDGGPPIFIGERGGRLLFAMGEKGATVLGGSVGDALATHPEWKWGQDAAAKYAPGRTIVGYANVARLVSIVVDQVKRSGDAPPFDVDQAVHELGLDGVISKYWQHGRDSSGAGGVAVAHLREDADRGFMKLVRQKPLDRRMLQAAPRDALWVRAGTLDLHGVWEEVVRIIGELAPEAGPQVASVGTMTRQLFGFSVTDDLLPNLGEQWLLFDAPDHGGLIFSGAVAVLAPRNGQELADMTLRLREVLAPFAAQGKVDLQAFSLEHNGHTIDYWATSGWPLPILPSALRLERWSAVSLMPQALAAAAPRLADPSVAGSILEEPAVVKALGGWPDELELFAQVDVQGAARTIYPYLALVHNALAAVGAPQQLRVDLHVLPPLPELVAEVDDLVFGGWSESDRYYLAYRGDVGLAAFGALTPAAVTTTALSASILLPSLARARELAKRSVSMSNLRGIAMAAQIYSNDHDGKFPDSFDVLVEGALITEKMLESPRSGGPSYVLIPGQTVRSSAENILLYEQVLDGEGTNAAFIDGHVEWLAYDEFVRRLRATYDRLGRADELPSEFRE